ncbi:antitermination protein N, partial [Escherichia coli]|nr:hypothetical protein [Escherichia coli]
DKTLSRKPGAVQTRRRERRAEKQAQWKADRILASTFRRNATKRHY